MAKQSAQRWLTLVTCSTLVGGALLLGASSDGRGTPQNAVNKAYDLLNERVAASASYFYVYQDADSALNHGFPSGLFGSATKLHVDPRYKDSASGPATQDRGTVLRVTFDPLRADEYAGLNFQEPEDYGARRSGIGYDLRGATAIVLDVRSPKGVSVQFGIDGPSHLSDPIAIRASSEYTTLRLPLSSLHLKPDGLLAVHILFTVVAKGPEHGGTLLVKNIALSPCRKVSGARPDYRLHMKRLGSVRQPNLPRPRRMCSLVTSLRSTTQP